MPRHDLGRMLAKVRELVKDSVCDIGFSQVTGFAKPGVPCNREGIGRRQ